MSFKINLGNIVHRFRDPIYGFIELNDAELEIVDTPLFQRLRRVNQLALTKYVYPTAEHSRFAHSLGVLQSATDIFENILSNSGKELISAATDDKIDQDIKKKLQILRFAALLHDIGHLPFSHAAERYILEEKADHEDVGQYIINNYQPIKDAIEKADIDPKFVAMLLGDNVISDYTILKTIISGQLDADRADYLLRDSYICGVKYGEYDYSRYIKSFYLKKNKNDIIQLCVEEKNIYLVESFLMARYHYNLQVPYHRTRVGYDLALKRYIKDLKDRGKFREFVKFNSENRLEEVDFDYFEFFDDYHMFEMIKKDYRQKENYWANILMRQDHLIPIYDHIKKNDFDLGLYRDIMYNFDNNPDLIHEDDYFKCSEKIEISKLVHENSLGLVPNGQSEVDDILKYSNVLKQLILPIEVLRMYVTKEKASVTGEFISDLRKKHDKMNCM